MVWAGLFAGMITGMCATAYGFFAAALPLWMSLMLYPAAGLGATGLVIAALSLRSWMQSQPVFGQAYGNRA
ncbi:hypothetical protein [Leisingera methylohalidivorans]|uniref:Uncharacterized protein n=1 Tax=Leisingera methylohalidivorans DSM 14336 TaxID=999552 RepID=V9VM12_9RHOB|nr:hypothetical protein [Leisingera methylohalidivorans]AHC99615.1 hypothetical protein METH_01820 [Leisingera methylohalidivorans DSM 14336]